MADDRTPGELGIGPEQVGVPAHPAHAGPQLTGRSGAASPGTGHAAEALCQKADWLARTTELPITPMAAPPSVAGRSTEPIADRLRRWGREYGGYLAAGALAAAVLTCSITGVRGAGITWHSGSPVVDVSPPATGQSSPTPGASTTRPASPSATPSRKPTRRPAVASRPRVTTSATRSPAATRTATATPAPGPVSLGPASAAALADVVDDYCDRRFDRSAVLLRPWEDSGAEDNWACVRRYRYDVIMANMTDACVVRYGSGVVARYLDAKDPFSWRCYRR